MRLINETDKPVVIEPGEEIRVDQLTVWTDDEKTIKRLYVRKLLGDEPSASSGSVAACPKCDDPSIYRRVTTQDWRCNSCGHVFDEPNYRNSKRDSKN